MGTTADKLEYLDGTKTAIKNAIVAKGVAVPDGTTFRAYAEKISSIQDVSSLPTQGAKTVTPTTTEQIAVASGRYTTGDVKVAGDANLVAENVAEGVSIFGVTGTHSGGAQACTLTVEFTASRSSLTIYYISPEMTELQTRKCESGNPPVFTLNVAKNTIAFFDSNNGWGITQLEGDATIIYGNLSQSGCAVYVYGDCRFESV